MIPATGHSWGEWETDYEATATLEGKRHRTCSLCGIKQFEVIPMLGTTDVNGNVDKEVEVLPGAPGTPSDTPSNTSETNNTTETITSLQTGDESKPFLWILIALFSGAAVVGFGKRKKTEQLEK